MLRKQTALPEMSFKASLTSQALLPSNNTKAFEETKLPIDLMFHLT